MKLRVLGVTMMLLLLTGCMTSGKMYVDLDEGKVLRVVEVGHGNVLEPGWNATHYAYCDKLVMREAVTYEVDFEEGFGPEMVTEIQETVKYLNCRDVQFRYASQPGWAPGAFGSAVTAAGTAYGLHQVGKGMAKQSEVTNIENSITNTVDNIVDSNNENCQGNCRGND